MDAHGDNDHDPAPAGKKLSKRITPTPERIDALRERGVQVYSRADTRSHGVLGIAVTTTQSFMQTRATEAAAGITYYALMSLFPLMVFSLTLLGAVFGQARIMVMMEAGINAVLPVGREFFHSFLDQTVQAPTSIQLISALVLLWSASSLFVQLSRHVEEAWQSLGARMSSIRDQTIGVLAVVAMMLLFGVVVLASMILSIVPTLLGQLIPGYHSLLGPVLAPLVPHLLPPLLIWVMLFGFYMLAPNVEVLPMAAAWAAGIAAVIWPIVYWGFGWWISDGLAHYQKLYGSLATVITLMLWMYISALLVLAGAHLCAAIQLHLGVPDVPDSTDNEVSAPALQPSEASPSQES